MCLDIIRNWCGGIWREKYNSALADLEVCRSELTLTHDALLECERERDKQTPAPIVNDKDKFVKSGVWMQAAISKMPECKLEHYPMDGKYWTANKAIWKLLVAWDWVNTKRYAAELWDCENYATLFKGRSDYYFGLNSCGIVIDYSSGHAYNLMVYPDGEVELFEPQSDTFHSYTRQKEEYVRASARSYLSLIIADAHMNPAQVSPMFLAACDYANYHREPIYCLGDFVQGLPHGYAKWRGCQCVEQVKETIHYYDLDLILLEGNHDPLELLKELFGDCSHITVAEQFNITWNDITYNLQHGHRFGPLWSWLRFLAPPFVNYMAEHYPQEWWDFAKKKGWIPSQIVSETEYHTVVLSLIIGGLKYIDEHDCRIAMGHVHRKIGVSEGGEYVLTIPAPLDTGCFITSEFQFASLL